MGATTDRTLDDRLAGVRRSANALDRDPSEWEPEHLIALAEIEGVLARVRTTAIYGMRSTGTTDKQIGEVLGTTQQAVSKRWPGGGRYVGAAGRYRTTNTQQETTT